MWRCVECSEKFTDQVYIRTWMGFELNSQLKQIWDVLWPPVQSGPGMDGLIAKDSGYESMSQSYRHIIESKRIEPSRGVPLERDTCSAFPWPCPLLCCGAYFSPNDLTNVYCCTHFSISFAVFLCPFLVIVIVPLSLCCYSTLYWRVTLLALYNKSITLEPIGCDVSLR